MRGAPLVACALIAGCGGDGIYLEVRPPPGSTATRVELFLGLSPCTIQASGGKVPCEHMQPSGFPTQERAAVYFRQPEALVAELSDGAARFHFQSEDKQLGVVIAVGFDGEKAVAAGSVADFDLSDPSLHVILDQSPAVELTQPRSSQDGEAVAIWYTSREARCVGVELDGSLAFVVPEADPDCDAVPAPECDPLGYKATRPGDKLCSARLPAASGPACMLGSVPCREDPSAPACLAELEPYCVPDAACPCGTDSMCLEGKLATSTVTRVSCTFHGVMNPNSQLIPCPGGPGAQPAMLDLTALGFAFKCSQGPKLGPAKLPLALGDELVLAGHKIKSRDFVQDPCGVSFEWEGAVTAPTSQRGLLDLSVVAGAKRRHVVLPMDITFAPGCIEQAICTLQSSAATDSIWTCAH